MPSSPSWAMPAFLLLLAVLPVLGLDLDTSTRDVPSLFLQTSSPTCSLTPNLPPTSYRHWHVRHTAHAGRGLFASPTARIPRGTLILAERPLLTITPPAFVPGLGYALDAMAAELHAAFGALDARQQEEYMSCFHAHEGQQERDRLMAIFRANAYSTADGRVALYPKVALINHSCAPNVVNGDDGEGQRVIVAARDIEPGEEILTTYIPLLTTTANRQHRLLQQYNFHCTCAACTLAADDTAREQAGADLQALEEEEDESHMLSSEDGLLRTAEALAVYVESEPGLSDYLVRTSRLAVEYAVRAPNSKGRAVFWAQRHLRHQRFWGGEQSRGVEEARVLLEGIVGGEGG